MRWILISMAILAALLFGYGFYKVYQLAQVVNCLYLPGDLEPKCVELK